MWGNIIIPSVFPYLVISYYIANSDMVSIFERFPGKLLAKTLNISPCSIRSVICSVFCGYPSGAVCAASHYKSELISINEAQRLICFTNNAGPLFLISAVGTGMLGSAKDGFAIYVIQLLSAFIYGLLSSRKKTVFKSCNIKSAKYETDFCDAVKSAVATITSICGFMVAAYVLSASAVIFFKKIFGEQLNITYANRLIKGFFEISAGVKAVAVPGCSKAEFALICGFVSWSGFSVIMQIKSVAGKIICFKKLAWAKFVQGVFSFGLGYGYKILSANTRPHMPSGYMIKISLIISVMLFLMYLTKKAK